MCGSNSNSIKRLEPKRVASEYNLEVQVTVGEKEVSDVKNMEVGEPI